MQRLDLYVERSDVAVAVLVLDARVGKLDVTIVVREFVLDGPTVNLLRGSIGSAVAVRFATIALLQELLVLALQLVIEHDAADEGTVFAEALGILEISAVDLPVMHQLARPVHDPGVHPAASGNRVADAGGCAAEPGQERRARAAVEIDGEYYWDGGLMSNTPLYEIAQASPRRDTLAFQVDLWSARGPVPDSIVDVMGRVKDIQYSSRTRMVTDTMQRAQRYRNVLRHVLEQVTEELRKNDAWCKLAQDLACSKRYNVIHLIYRHKEYEGHYKDYQFGLSTMREHWESGLQDIRGTLAHHDWLDMPDGESHFVTHDIHRDIR